MRAFYLTFLSFAVTGCGGPPSTSEIETLYKQRMEKWDRADAFIIKDFTRLDGFEVTETIYEAEVSWFAVAIKNSDDYLPVAKAGERKQKADEGLLEKEFGELSESEVDRWQKINGLWSSAVNTLGGAPWGIGERRQHFTKITLKRKESGWMIDHTDSMDNPNE